MLPKVHLYLTPQGLPPPASRSDELEGSAIAGCPVAAPARRSDEKTQWMAAPPTSEELDIHSYRDGAGISSR